jgi:hypothetical protein
MNILMLGLWLALVGISASDHLHHLLHADSHHLHHECVVTSLSKCDPLLITSTTTAPAAVFACFGLLLLMGCPPIGRGDVSLTPARAPPVGFLLPQ